MKIIELIFKKNEELASTCCSSLYFYDKGDTVVTKDDVIDISDGKDWSEAQFSLRGHVCRATTSPTTTQAYKFNNLLTSYSTAYYMDFDENNNCTVKFYIPDECPVTKMTFKGTNYTPNYYSPLVTVNVYTKEGSVLSSNTHTITSSNQNTAIEVQIPDVVASLDSINLVPYMYEPDMTINILDIVIYDNNLYLCNQKIDNTTSFDVDKQYLKQLTYNGTIIKELTPLTSYSAGEAVYHENGLYQLISDFTTTENLEEDLSNTTKFKIIFKSLNPTLLKDYVLKETNKSLIDTSLIERLKEIDTLVSQSGIVLSGKYLNTTIQPDENGVLDLNALFVQSKVDNPPPSFIRREAIIATTANTAKTILPLDGYKISSLPVSVEILTRAAQASSQVISFNTFEKDNFEYDENVVDFSNTGAKLKDNIAVESTLGDDGTYSVDLTQFNNLNDWRLI